MELPDGTREVVDPEVRAYVSSLVTALGGSGADEDGRYVLGDDALACLRDLKRWLKLYDEKANRMDVARCLAESNLVNGDLLQILAAWPENATDDKIKSKIALACLELLVPLTWPIERNGEMTVNHHRHAPYLQLAQLGYKRSIINFDGARILHTAVRVALPSMAQPPDERSSRDQGIIRLVLYFLRNIAMIAPPPNITYEGDEAEISRSATIDAYDYQDIFHLLLTISSTMGEDFNLQDVIILEILFHLIKGMDIHKLFLNEAQLDNKKVDELVALRTKEAGMQRGYARAAPTRHNRFGTMIWVQREDHKMSTVSGQDALIDGARSLAKMDKGKKYKPPRRHAKSGDGPLDFSTPVALTFQANKHLRSFVEEFLDSGFNPLFQHIRKAIDREADRVLEYHLRQFFYLVAWFLEAERVRRSSKNSSKNKHKTAPAPGDVDSFSLVASVLNQEMFITLNRAMEMAYENKAWQDLNAAMRCFTQILLTVQEMSESPLEEDQEIAENILSRIFYEETTHDRVANITRYYKDQGFGYLDACTEMTHNYLRILENYSKQNTDLMVRSKRRLRRKKKALHEPGEGSDDDNVDESEREDEAQAARISQDRKFDFKRFAIRFVSQGCVDTFVKFCKFHNDLNEDQLKRCHRYFYRVAFKQEMAVMLYRIDILALFHKMIKGPEGLDPACIPFKEWDELVRQLIKRCIRKLQERPELIVEMLFSKTSGTGFFLQYGYEKQTLRKGRSRPGPELEVRGDMPKLRQLEIVVSAILVKDDGDDLDWIKSRLVSAQAERKSWEAMAIAIRPADAETTEVTLVEDQNAQTQSSQAPSIVLRPDNEARKIAFYKNGYIRLLLTLLGLKKVDDEDTESTSWIIPSSISAIDLDELIMHIETCENDPLVFNEGLPEDLIKKKAAASQPRQAFDDDDDNDDSGEEFMFAPGGPTAIKKSDALAALKQRRRRRRSISDDDIDPNEAEERRRAREQARKARELEKMRKLKSEVYVHDSDDESDEERDRLFFEQEEKLRQRSKIEALKELLNVGEDNSTAAKSKQHATATKKRKMTGSFLDDDSDTDVGIENRFIQSSSEHEDREETPLSSPHLRSSQTKRLRISSQDSEDDSVHSNASTPRTAKDVRMTDVVEAVPKAGADDEDDVPIARPARRRVIGAFVDDSSDDE